MGLVSADKTIYYKPDAYTRLNLGYGKAARCTLPLALYDSRSMLLGEEMSKRGFMTQWKGSEPDEFLQY